MENSRRLCKINWQIIFLFNISSQNRINIFVTEVTKNIYFRRDTIINVKFYPKKYVCVIDWNVFVSGWFFFNYLQNHTLFFKRESLIFIKNALKLIRDCQVVGIRNDVKINQLCWFICCQEYSFGAVRHQWRSLMRRLWLLYNFFG